MKYSLICLFLCFQAVAAKTVWKDATFIKVGDGLYTQQEAKSFSIVLDTIKCSKPKSVLSVNFVEGWKIFQGRDWSKQVKVLKEDQTKLSPIITLLRLLEYEKKFNKDKLIGSKNLKKIKSTKCWSKYIGKDEFHVQSAATLIQLEAYLEDKYFGGAEAADRGTKSLQVLIETLTNQMSYEFYAL